MQKKCNCRKARCLKLYCVCFSAGTFCEGCACQDCVNIPRHKDLVFVERNKILQRSPRAFAPKVRIPSASCLPDASHLPRLLPAGCVTLLTHCLLL